MMINSLSSLVSAPLAAFPQNLGINPVNRLQDRYVRWASPYAAMATGLACTGCNEIAGTLGTAAVLFAVSAKAIPWLVRKMHVDRQAATKEYLEELKAKEKEEIKAVLSDVERKTSKQHTVPSWVPNHLRQKIASGRYADITQDDVAAFTATALARRDRGRALNDVVPLLDQLVQRNDMDSRTWYDFVIFYQRHILLPVRDSFDNPPLELPTGNPQECAEAFERAIADHDYQDARDKYYMFLYNLTATDRSLIEDLKRHRFFKYLSLLDQILAAGEKNEVQKIAGMWVANRHDLIGEIERVTPGEAFFLFSVINQFATQGVEEAGEVLLRYYNQRENLWLHGLALNSLKNAI